MTEPSSKLAGKQAPENKFANSQSWQHKTRMEKCRTMRLQVNSQHSIHRSNCRERTEKVEIDTMEKGKCPRSPMKTIQKDNAFSGVQS